MKKIKFLFLPFILFSSFCFAYNIDQPHRFIEFGMDTSFGISNNFFAVKEMLVKDLVIDFTKMSNEMPEKGLQFNANLFSDVFFNLNVKNFHLGLKTGLETNGIGGISKDLFDFLGKGNKLSEELSIKMNTNLDVFAFVQAETAFNVLGFRLGLMPAVYRPLLHAETPKARAFFVNDKDGAVKAGVEMQADLYSLMNLESLIEDKKFDSADFLEALKEGWGFDFGATLEHKILDSLQGRIYARIPIKAGSLSDFASVSYTTIFETTSIIDMIQNGKTDDLVNSESQNTYGKEKMSISRPLRLGAEIAWRPFGKYIRFGAQLGLGVKYPYTSEAKAYPEYVLDWEAALFNIIGLNVATKYQAETYIHQAGIMINARVLELDVGASLQGGSFTQSFQGSGAGAYIGIRMGF